MRRGSRVLCLLSSVFWYLSLVLSAHIAYAQNTALPTADELDQLLAPIALYPDALVAQICTASTDPQQILDANTWLQQNSGLSGQARTDAAQAQGFDPAFIALINFPQVLGMMAQNIDSYATIGRAFSANQATVMDSIQRLRQQAYAAGALQSNEYQNVQVQDQGGVQAITVVPANPQVVYVPVYNPQVVYVQPSTSTVVATSLVTFGAGIALGAWIANNSYPWGWGGSGWNWGHRTVIVHHNTWVVHNYYRPPHPSYHYRPPAYGPPIYVRPPNNWHDRPYYRPPSGGRPPGSGPPPGGRPPAVNPVASRRAVVARVVNLRGTAVRAAVPAVDLPALAHRVAAPVVASLRGSGAPGSGSGGRPPGTGAPGGGSGGGKPPGTGAPSSRPSPSVPPQALPATRPATPGASRPQPQTRPSTYAGYPSKTPSNSAGAPPPHSGEVTTHPPIAPPPIAGARASPRSRNNRRPEDSAGDQRPTPVPARSRLAGCPPPRLLLPGDGARVVAGPGGVPTDLRARERSGAGADRSQQGEQHGRAQPDPRPGGRDPDLLR